MPFCVCGAKDSTVIAIFLLWNTLRNISLPTLKKLRSFSSGFRQQVLSYILYTKLKMNALGVIK